MKRLIIRPEAESEIRQAFDWYEKQRIGLGESFLLSFEDALNRILESPLLFPMVYKKARRALIHRFPYAVYFVSDEKMVAVLSVCHCSRSPAEWKKWV